MQDVLESSAGRARDLDIKARIGGFNPLCVLDVALHPLPCSLWGLKAGVLYNLPMYCDVLQVSWLIPYLGCQGWYISFFISFPHRNMHKTKGLLGLE